MPIFSIIIPVYNVEKYIQKCVESVIHQTFTDFEAIIVDDYSNDDSMKIVEKYAKNDDRIKILKHDKNCGVAASRNTALNYVKGEYIICIDPDDWIELNTLEVIYNNFKDNNDIDSVWFDANRFYENSQTFDKISVIQCVQGYLTIQPHLICSYTEYSWGKAYRTNLMKKYNICWPKNTRFGEDGEFYYKYFSLFPKVKIIEDRLYNYRMREYSLTTNMRNSIVNMSDFYDPIKNLIEFYKENNIYDKYKIALLHLIKRKIYDSRWVNGRYHEAMELSNKLLQDLNFLDTFKEVDLQINPLITVILAIKNKSAEIVPCIQSILAQSYRNIELLCVDNSSDRNIEKHIKKYVKLNPKIKYIKDEKNNSYVDIAKKQATGKISIFIKNIQYLDYDYINNILKKYRENPYIKIENDYVKIL